MVQCEHSNTFHRTQIPHNSAICTRNYLFLPTAVYHVHRSLRWVQVRPFHQAIFQPTLCLRTYHTIYSIQRSMLRRMCIKSQQSRSKNDANQRRMANERWCWKVLSRYRIISLLRTWTSKDHIYTHSATAIIITYCSITAETEKGRCLRTRVDIHDRVQR